MDHPGAAPTAGDTMPLMKVIAVFDEDDGCDAFIEDDGRILHQHSFTMPGGIGPGDESFENYVARWWGDLGFVARATVEGWDGDMARRRFERPIFRTSGRED